MRWINAFWACARIEQKKMYSTPFTMLLDELTLFSGRLRIFFDAAGGHATADATAFIIFVWFEVVWLICWLFGDCCCTCVWNSSKLQCSTIFTWHNWLNLSYLLLLDIKVVIICNIIIIRVDIIIVIICSTWR